jgi:type VI secretion system protein ImpA
LAGLNGEGAEGVLIAPIRNTKITENSSVGAFTYWQYQQAIEVHRISDEDAQEERSKKLGFSIADIEKAIDESSPEFITGIRDSLADCIATYRAISRSLDERCGSREAPPTSNIINILEECQSAVLHLGKSKFPVEEEPEAELEQGSEVSRGNSDAGVQKNSGGPIATREQAFKQLLIIAEFFRKTEPHSPVSYVLEKSVKWGNMPLQELMKELIPDSSSLQHYGMLTGVKTEDQG